MPRLGDYMVPIHRGEFGGFVEGQFRGSTKRYGNQAGAQHLPRIFERTVLVLERGQENAQGFGILDL